MTSLLEKIAQELYNSRIIYFGTDNELLPNDERHEFYMFQANTVLNAVASVIEERKEKWSLERSAAARSDFAASLRFSTKMVEASEIATSLRSYGKNMS